MAKRSRRNHGADFKAKAALAAIRGDMHAHQITEWKQLLERAGEVFDNPRRKDEPPVDLKALHAKIGKLALSP